jgi:hypothetical protein
VTEIAYSDDAYREFVRGKEPMCTVEYDGVTREGYVRAWSARRAAERTGWWANVILFSGGGDGARPLWVHEDDVTEVPEP